MKNENLKAMQTIDVVGQVCIVALSVIVYHWLFLGLFVGGAWQLISYTLIRVANNGGQSEARKAYWFWVRIVLAVISIGAILFGIGCQTSSGAVFTMVFLCAVIALVGGIILYISYLAICIAELLFSQHVNTSTHEN